MIFIIGKFHHTYCDIVKPDESVAKLPISINVFAVATGRGPTYSTAIL